jgi:hypothetical protein
MGIPHLKKSCIPANPILPHTHLDAASSSADASTAGGGALTDAEAGAQAAARVAAVDCEGRAPPLAAAAPGGAGSGRGGGCSAALAVVPRCAESAGDADAVPCQARRRTSTRAAPEAAGAPPAAGGRSCRRGGEGRKWAQQVRHCDTRASPLLTHMVRLELSVQCQGERGDRPPAALATRGPCAARYGRCYGQCGGGCVPEGAAARVGV